MKYLCALLFLAVGAGAGCGGGDGSVDLPLGGWEGSWQNTYLNQSGAATVLVTDQDISGTLSISGGGQTTFRIPNNSTQAIVNQNTSCGVVEPFGYSESGAAAFHLRITFQCPGTGAYLVDVTQPRGSK